MQVTEVAHMGPVGEVTPQKRRGAHPSNIRTKRARSWARWGNQPAQCACTNVPLALQPQRLNARCAKDAQSVHAPPRRRVTDRTAQDGRAVGKGTAHHKEESVPDPPSEDRGPASSACVPEVPSPRNDMGTASGATTKASEEELMEQNAEAQIGMRAPQSGPLPQLAANCALPSVPKEKWRARR